MFCQKLKNSLSDISQTLSDTFIRFKIQGSKQDRSIVCLITLIVATQESLHVWAQPLVSVCGFVCVLGEAGNGHFVQGSCLSTISSVTGQRRIQPDLTPAGKSSLKEECSQKRTFCYYLLIFISFHWNFFLELKSWIFDIHCMLATLFIVHEL